MPALFRRFYAAKSSITVPFRSICALSVLLCLPGGWHGRPRPTGCRRHCRRGHRSQRLRDPGSAGNGEGRGPGDDLDRRGPTSAGIYEFPQITVGNIEVRCEAPGFTIERIIRLC